MSRKIILAAGFLSVLYPMPAMAAEADYCTDFPGHDNPTFDACADAAREACERAGKLGLDGYADPRCIDTAMKTGRPPAPSPEGNRAKRN
jgi:hypothetical protein